MHPLSIPRISEMQVGFIADLRGQARSSFFSGSVSRVRLQNFLVANARSLNALDLPSSQHQCRDFCNLRLVQCELESSGSTTVFTKLAVLFRWLVAC